MKKLIIHLKKVEKVGNKIFNTLVFHIKNDKELNNHLNTHKGNIQSHRVVFYKV